MRVRTPSGSRPGRRPDRGCALCGDAQEGDETTIDGHDFDLLMGQPVVFPLASSSVRPDDRPGDLVVADPDSIRELPPLQSLMRVGRKAKADASPSAWPRGSRRSAPSSSGASREPTPAAGGYRSSFAARRASPSAGRGRRCGDRPGDDRAVRARRGHRRDPRRLRSLALGSRSETGPARLIKRLEELIDVPRDQLAALCASCLVGAAARPGRSAAEEPSA